MPPSRVRSKHEPGRCSLQADPLFITRIERVVALAARHAIPTMYPFREFAVAGGLISYGTSLIEDWRQIGLYTGRILKGEKPADLPVIQATKIQLYRVPLIRTRAPIGAIRGT